MTFSAIFCRSRNPAEKAILKVGVLFLLFHCLLVGVAWFEGIIIALKTTGLTVIVISVIDLPIAFLVFFLFQDISNHPLILMIFALGGRGTMVFNRLGTWEIRIKSFNKKSTKPICRFT